MVVPTNEYNLQLVPIYHSAYLEIKLYLHKIDVSPQFTRNPIFWESSFFNHENNLYYVLVHLSSNAKQFRLAIININNTNDKFFVDLNSEFEFNCIRRTYYGIKQNFFEYKNSKLYCTINNKIFCYNMITKNMECKSKNIVMEFNTLIEDLYDDGFLAIDTRVPCNINLINPKLIQINYPCGKKIIFQSQKNVDIVDYDNESVYLYSNDVARAIKIF